MKKYYDNIINGASISGIIYAAHRSAAGESVLLINKYGFPGGGMTECLNCLQQLPPEKGPVLKSILDKTESENLNTFYKENQKAVFNPEVIKIVLQKFIAEYDIDILYHVIPAKVNDKKDYIELTVIAKEGKIEFSAGKVVDATGDFHIDYLTNKNRKAAGASYSFFTTPEVDVKIFQSPGITEFVELTDGRYWASMDVPPADPRFINAAAQEELDRFAGSIRKGRIHLVPARAHIDYEPTLPATESSNRIFSVEAITGKVYKPTGELLKSCDIEKKLSKNE